MPYLKTEDRIRVVASKTAKTSGELNFLLTKLFIKYVEDNGLSYQTLNDVLGAASGAKAEFYWKVVRPYEESKIKLNGDLNYPVVI